MARVKVQCGSAAGGSNTKDVKQMLLDWCRAKTEPYEVGLDENTNFSFGFSTLLANLC